MPASDIIDFRDLFEKTPGQYLVLDPDFVILAATDGYCRLTLTRREAIVGRDLFEVFPDNPDDPAADGVSNLRASLGRVLALRRRDPMPIRRYDVRRPDGTFEQKYWSPMNVPVLHDNGEVRWIIHRVHDVTHTVLEGDTERTRRRLERERQPIVQALRDANRELAEMEHLPEQLIQLSRLNSIALMSATIAHDMRQPLTAAKTYAATLQRALASPRPGVDAADLAAKVERQIDRSIQIVSSMRSFLTGTRSGSCPDELDDLVGEAVVLSEFAIRDRGVQIVNAIPGDLPRVMVERAQIQQVLINLIVNAAEAMAQSVTRQVRISAEYLTAEKMVRIDVADSGPGLAPEVAANMFRPFTTTKRSGMGLGLSICREIVKAHGGQIWTAPNQPNGTVFAFTLPLADPQSSNALLEAG